MLNKDSNKRPPGAFEGAICEDKTRRLSLTETRKKSEIFDDARKYILKISENFNFLEDNKIEVSI